MHWIPNNPEVLSSASDKAKLLSENFSKNSNLDDSGISLSAFPSRTTLKLHNVSVTPKIVKKVITNLDLPKASGPGCIPVKVLKKCEPFDKVWHEGFIYKQRQVSITGAALALVTAFLITDSSM